MTNLELSRFLYCRSCAIKAQHYKDLKHSWGYSCKMCGTWQHESQFITIQTGYAARAILATIESGQISHHKGTIEEFIEAAEALNMDYDYEKTADGHNFIAWKFGEEENPAKIKI